MQYRTMPKNGEQISALGYGCMRFPTKGVSIDEKKATELIKYAINNGVNYFDTAYPYHGGQSESFLGKVLQGDLRKKVKIATKLPPWSVKTYEDMDRILDEQLDKLQTDYIDYYLVHSILNIEDWNRLVDLGLFKFLEIAKEQGKIRNIGFSFHSNYKNFETIIDAYDWDFCQIQYNYLDESNQAGTKGLEYAAKKNIGVVIMEPLRGGSLAGEMPKEIDSIWKESPLKRSHVDWALRWIYNRTEVITVLSGMGEQQQIEENIETANTSFPNKMSVEEIQIVEKVRDKFKELMKVPCTGCGYCMPCPVGVNIPGCFEQYNNSNMFSKMGAKTFYLGMIGGAMGGQDAKASNCIDCGKCEKICPQHIEIRKELKNVTKRLEGIFDRQLMWIIKKVMKAKK